jgi:hypothetical protein
MFVHVYKLKNGVKLTSFKESASSLDGISFKDGFILFPIGWSASCMRKVYKIQDGEIADMWEEPDGVH